MSFKTFCISCVCVEKVELSGTEMELCIIVSTFCLTGSVLCDPQNPIKSAMRIRARIVIFNLELPITKGFTVRSKMFSYK